MTEYQHVTKQTSRSSIHPFIQYSQHLLQKAGNIFALAYQLCRQIAVFFKMGEQPKLENAQQPTPFTTATYDDSLPKTYSWWYVGEYDALTLKKCRRLHCKAGTKYDLALFYENRKLYAVGAWCSHMGGPLYLGQIEDYKGSCHVMCPWHAYMFDLVTGKNELGLEQEIFEIKVERGQVFVKHFSEVSLYPYL